MLRRENFGSERKHELCKYFTRDFIAREILLPQPVMRYVEFVTVDSRMYPVGNALKSKSYFATQTKQTRDDKTW